MFSAILHLIFVPVIAIGAAMIYASWKRQQFKTKMAQQIFVFFLFLAGYHGLLGLPMILFGLNSLAIGIGYVGAILFLFLALFPAVNVAMDMMSASPKLRSFARISLGVLGMAVTILHLVEMPASYVVDGTIFYNASMPAGILIGVSVFFVVILFLAVERIGWPGKIERIQRIKAVMFSVGCLLMGVASLFYYASTDVMLTRVSSATSFVGTCLVVVSLLVGKHRSLQKQR